MKDRNKIIYQPRYSQTDEYDKQGRWARIAYYNGVQIAWISKYKFIHSETNEEIETFDVRPNFPTAKGSDTAMKYPKCKTYEECVDWLENEWEYFKTIVNGTDTTNIWGK